MKAEGIVLFDQISLFDRNNTIKLIMIAREYSKAIRELRAENQKLRDALAKIQRAAEQGRDGSPVFEIDRLTDIVDLAKIALRSKS